MHGVEHGNPVAYSHASRCPSRHQARACRGAVGVGGIAMRERQSFLGELVEVGRVGLLAAIAA